MGRKKRIKGVKYMVMGDVTLGGGHTMQYTDYVSQKCVLEAYIIELTSVIPINLI